MLDRRRTSLTTLLAATSALACSLAFAGPRLADQEQPLRYNPRSLDGPLTTVTAGLDGRTWSAWAYRDGAEYDIALSFRDPGGFWSEPQFIGRDDGADQVQPALAVDTAGTVYLAFADLGTGTIRYTALPAGGAAWTAATAVTRDGERGFMPALSVVGERLVIAFRSGRAVVIRDVPLLDPTALRPGGIHDSPDPYGNNDSGSGRTTPGDGG